MVILQASLVPTSDFVRFAWSGVKRFQHVPSVVEMLMKLHDQPNSEKDNVKKQANNLRQCLIQAREYADAASATSLVTKPVLLYYSLMNLAMAQNLFKGDGNYSLDMARAKHKHHGLEFNMRNYRKSDYDLAEKASSLIAIPVGSDTDRKGTFELWHGLSREDPIIGPATKVNDNGTRTTNETQVLFVSNDKRPGYMPAGGMSFFDCLTGSPGMVSWLRGVGIPTQVVRANINCTFNRDMSQVTTLIVHPHDVQGRVENLQDEIVMHPSSVDKVQMLDFPQGFGLVVREEGNEAVELHLPPATVWRADDIRFIPSRTKLNEFGYLYVGLFILGNYARYYPDAWIDDVEKSTPLSLAAEEFVSMAEGRMALLTLSELSQKYFIPRTA